MSCFLAGYFHVLKQTVEGSSRSKLANIQALFLPFRGIQYFFLIANSLANELGIK